MLIQVFRRMFAKMPPVSSAVKTFDYLVLGGGSGGIASARRAAEFGVSVGLIEHGRQGGTCVSLDIFHRAECRFKRLTLTLSLLLWL